MAIATDNLERPKESLKDTIGRYVTLTALIGGCGVLALALVSASHKSEHIPLVNRLEQSYQQCQKIEDKSKEVAFAPSVYASCKEIEHLYLETKK